MKEGSARRFDGKSVIVTGASGGIGGAIVDGFLRGGASVLGIGRDAEALRSFANQRVGAKLETAVVDQAAMMAIRTQMQVAMDLMGSYSTAHEYHVEKYFRDLQQAALWLGGRYRVQMDTVLDYYPYEWS